MHREGAGTVQPLVLRYASPDAVTLPPLAGVALAMPGVSRACGLTVSTFASSETHRWIYVSRFRVNVFLLAVACCGASMQDRPRWRPGTRAE